MLSKRFVQNFYRTNCFHKLLSTAENLQLVDDKKKIAKVEKKSKSAKTSVSTEIRNYLKGSDFEYFIDNIPKKILRKQCKRNSTLYLINRDTAKELSLMISEDLLKNTSFVIECNPGLGLLTQELLNIGIPFINLYEKHGDFLSEDSPLTTVFKKYQKHLKLTKLNFFDIWMILLRDKNFNENLAKDFLTDVPFHSWKKETFAQIIAVSPDRHFLSLLLHNFFNQTFIFDHGRPMFFIVVSSLVWKRMSLDNTDKKLCRFYSQYNVLFNLFFDVKYLGELPRKSFAPWPTDNSNKKINDITIPMCVLKLEPKTSAFDLIQKDDLKAFWFFLKHCLRSKRIRVFVEFEKWVPGCGPRLIEQDLHICTLFKELSPKKLLEIFIKFRTWPEYDENLFVPAEDLKKDDEEKVEGEDEQENEPAPVISQTLLIDAAKEENQGRDSASGMDKLEGEEEQQHERAPANSQNLPSDAIK